MRPVVGVWPVRFMPLLLSYQKDFKNELLNDSKQLTEHQRYALREVIEKEALAWAVGVVTPAEIDEINILNASFLAMHRAVDGLKLEAPTSVDRWKSF